MRDQHEIAMRCLEVENAGGNVIEFLKGRGHISPRATWIRLQLNELGRDEKKLTDGRGGMSMAFNKNAKLTPEMKKRAADIALDGGNQYEFLLGCGVKNASASWVYVKQWLQKHDPVKYARLMDLSATVQRSRRSKGRTVSTETAPETAPEDAAEAAEDEPAEQPENAAEEPVEAQEEAEEQEEEPETAEEPEKAVNPDDMRIWLPICYDGYTVRQVEKDYGKYSFSQSQGRRYIDWESRDGDVISMTVEEWKAFGKEFVGAARVLGVDMRD